MYASVVMPDESAVIWDLGWNFWRPEAARLVVGAESGAWWCFVSLRLPRSDEKQLQDAKRWACRWLSASSC
jgi:hypothetical protein